MASNKKSQKTPGQNQELDEELIEGQMETDESDDEEAPIENSVEPTDEPKEPASEPQGELTSVEPIPAEVPAPRLNLHQRLEALELSMLGKPAAQGWSVNKVTILTGTLKTALPEAVHHVEDQDVREGLKRLLEIL